MKKLLIINVFAFICSPNIVAAQNKPDKKITLSKWDGMVITGYVDKGGYVNFGGPSIRLNKKNWAFGFGILPTMRVKKEIVSKDTPKNAMITPTAGFGFTFSYRHLVIQAPFYYNTKTATANGKWNPGIGLGFKF